MPYLQYQRTQRRISSPEKCRHLNSPPIVSSIDLPPSAEDPHRGDFLQRSLQTPGFERYSLRKSILSGPNSRLSLSRSFLNSIGNGYRRWTPRESRSPFFRKQTRAFRGNQTPRQRLQKPSVAMTCLPAVLPSIHPATGALPVCPCRILLRRRQSLQRCVQELGFVGALGNVIFLFNDECIHQLVRGHQLSGRRRPTCPHALHAVRPLDVDRYRCRYAMECRPRQ